MLQTICHQVRKKIWLNAANCIVTGSERQDRTQASGQRLKESGSINRSLSLLNNVSDLRVSSCNFL